MAGLLSDVLPYLYSQGDRAKRYMKGLLSDPVGSAQQTAGLLGDKHREMQALQAQAFPDQSRPFKVGDSKAMGQMAEAMLNGPLGFAPVGMFIGPNAKTWDKTAAQLAQKLDASGVDPRAIWKETGTFKGPDGKWRQEIDDSAASFIDKGFTTLPGGSVTSKSARLGTQLDHPAFYAAYPSASKMDAAITTNRGSGGTGSYSGGMIEATGPNKSEALGTTLHEIQHAVQDVEKFAKGGNSQMAYLDKQAFRVLDDVRARMSTPQSIEDYVRSAGFGSVAEAAPSYADYVKSLKQAPPTWLEHEIQRAAAKEYYRRLAGEAEARATQARMNMGMQQRRDLFPFDSYDVPIDQLILR